jgi:hypothetical protein
VQKSRSNVLSTGTLSVARSNTPRFVHASRLLSIGASCRTSNPQATPSSKLPLISSATPTSSSSSTATPSLSTTRTPWTRDTSVSSVRSCRPASSTASRCRSSVASHATSCTPSSSELGPSCPQPPARDRRSSTCTTPMQPPRGPHSGCLRLGAAIRRREHRGPATADPRGAGSGCFDRVGAHPGIHRGRPIARQRPSQEQAADTRRARLDRHPDSSR